MAGGRTHEAVGHVRRFFWWPPGPPRRPAPAVTTLLVWVACAAMGACLTALGWADAVIVMMVGAVLTMLDDVTKGVRHRWPAFVIAMAAGWGVDRMGYAVAPESVSLWGEFGLFALWTAVALAVFVGVTRLPWPRHRSVRPSGA